MHLVHAVDRFVSQLEGPEDLRRGVAAAAAVHAAVAPGSALWQRAAPAGRSRKSGKGSAAAADIAAPALAATLRVTLRLLGSCVRACRTPRHDLLGALCCAACCDPSSSCLAVPTA